MYTGRKTKHKRKHKKPTETKSDKMPSLQEFIKKRDYTGATVLLEFNRQTGDVNERTLPWLGFSYFHLGEYQKALDVYNDIIVSSELEDVDTYHLYAACCSFYLGDYESAEESALKGPNTRLKNRLLFHIAHRQNDEAKLIQYHAKISETTEDQLSLASIHYLRCHYHEATEIYKRLVFEYDDYLACRVYVALCYYKLDYYDVSLEILASYLQKFPTSSVAVNLKACNHYKLYDGKGAEAELKVALESSSAKSMTYDNDLIKHNLVVFRGGENAPQVLPLLVDTLPEARLNLVIYHLRNNEIMEAHDLIKDLDPNTPQEYILRGVVAASVGQLQDSREQLKQAQQYFQLVGASTSECDTIPGRQCMASCFFLLKQFEDVLIYLNSVKQYSSNDDIFNYNYGVAQCNCENYAEAEEALLLVQDEGYRQEYCYLSHLARCFIFRGKADAAWMIYASDRTLLSTTDSYALLLLIANDCYKVGAFYYAAKAFAVLERIEETPDVWEGKRGACCGVFQQVIAGKENREHLREVIMMLRSAESSPQAEFMIRVMTKWAQENGMADIPQA